MKYLGLLRLSSANNEIRGLLPSTEGVTNMEILYFGTFWSIRCHRFRSAWPQNTPLGAIQVSMSKRFTTVSIWTMLINCWHPAAITWRPSQVGWRPPPKASFFRMSTDGKTSMDDGCKALHHSQILHIRDLCEDPCMAPRGFSNDNHHQHTKVNTKINGRNKKASCCTNYIKYGISK